MLSPPLNQIYILEDEKLTCEKVSGNLTPLSFLNRQTKKCARSGSSKIEKSVIFFSKRNFTGGVKKSD